MFKIRLFSPLLFAFLEAEQAALTLPPYLLPDSALDLRPGSDTLSGEHLGAYLA